MTDQPTTIASLVVPSRLTCLGAPNQKLSQNALSRLSPSEHVNNFWAMEKSGSIIFASQFVRVDVTTTRFQPSERWRWLAGKEMCRDLPRNEDTFHHLVLGCPGYSNPSIIRHTTKRRGCQAALETCKSIVFTRRGNNDDNEGFVVLVIRRFFFCHTRVRLVDSMHTSGYRERACCWRYCQGNKNYNLDWKKLLAAGPCVGWETTSMQKSGKHGSDN